MHTKKSVPNKLKVWNRWNWLNWYEAWMRLCILTRNDMRKDTKFMVSKSAIFIEIINIEMCHLCADSLHIWSLGYPMVKRNQINFNIISCLRMSDCFFSFFCNCLCTQTHLQYQLEHLLLRAIGQPLGDLRLHTYYVSDYWVWEMYAKFTRFSQQIHSITNVASFASWIFMRRFFPHSLQ